VNHLKVLKEMLEALPTKARSHFSDWGLCEDYYPGTHVLTIGCPDGKAGYAQFVFDAKGRCLEVKTIDGTGRECSCKYCIDTNKVKCGCDHSPCEHDRPAPRKVTIKKARKA
jgi:hypothetical protein